MELEYCIICDEPTGRAGKMDDSIYHTLKHPFYNLKTGDELGPVCEKCNEALIQLMLVSEN